MTTINDVNDLLRKNKVTCNWDVLLAYDRNKINKLCYEQYVDKVAENKHFPIFNYNNEKYGILFKDIVLGPPLISFENSNVTDSSVIVRLKFISGALIYTDSANQVIQWDNITTGHDYGLKVKVELKQGIGNVSQDGDITIHFDQGTLLDVEGLGELPDEVLSVFRNYLKNTQVDYSMGELTHDNMSNDLYPQKFIVRTQPHPDSNNKNSNHNEDGAILVFISTREDGVGNLPSYNQPWIIPDNKSSTMVIHDKLLFGPFLADIFKERITHFQSKTEYVSGDKSGLCFTDGYIETTNVIKGYVKSLFSTVRSRSASSYYSSRKARLSMSDFLIQADDDGSSISGKFTNPVFYDLFAYDLNAPLYYSSGVENIKFNRKGYFKAKLSLDKDDNVVFNGGVDFQITDTSSNVSIGTSASRQFAKEATDNLNQSDLFEIPSIKTFYLKNILFPGKNILHYDDVAIPSDLVLYGNMVESLTSLTIEPQETSISCGQTINFKTYSQDGSELSSSVTWSVSGVGKINQNGVYTAPDIGSITQNKNVVITAKHSDGRKGIALITLLVSPLSLTTSFISFTENKSLEPFTFKAVLPSSNSSEQVKWSLEPENNTVVSPTEGFDIGSIDNYGIYTPPKGNYPEGYYILSILATVSGHTERALVCLKNEDSTATEIKPAFYDGVTSVSDKKLLSTSVRRIDADKWTLIPPVGSLSEVRSYSDPKNTKNTIWETDYTAPSVITHPQLVVIKAGSKDERDDDFAGISIINLLPDQSVWSQVNSLAFFQIMSYQGTQEDTIYGNGLNQSTMVIKITALDENENEIKIPTEDIYPYITLIDFNTGEDISLDENWSYTIKKNEYNRHKTEGNDDNVLLYVTCKSGGYNKKVAAKIRLTKPGAEIKEYSTGLHSTAGLDSSVNITSLAPIDYRKEENYTLERISPVKIVDNLLWASSASSNSHTGQLHRYSIKFSPKANLGTVFKEIQLRYSPILNGSVNRKTQNWATEYEEDSFSLLGNEGLPCCGVNHYSGDQGTTAKVMVMISSGEKDYGENACFNGNVYFQNVNGKEKYRLHSGIRSYSSFTENNGSLNFTGYEFSIPDKKAEELGWVNSLNEVRATVTDEYGNTSNLTFRWDDNNNYAYPAIY
ncbi:hypothetical protein [Proteus myxofaciens]|uniref:Uncharacterized protein n=1 Tax=Proteus myxofaciens ATCC 19692 TaxID=1354337 RepID=A0A198GKD5_9GAMM|nr:hypothetical protein [Proteus myxofaciens]OAT37548.1 hypothetical protein M983_0324 [Proteus myxofaciens ATCC 19692]